MTCAASRQGNAGAKPPEQAESAVFGTAILINTLKAIYEIGFIVASSDKRRAP